MSKFIRVRAPEDANFEWLINTDRITAINTTLNMVSFDNPHSGIVISIDSMEDVLNAIEEGADD